MNIFHHPFAPRFVFPFIMTGFMDFFMSLIITYMNIGFAPGFFGIWLKAFLGSFILAYPISFFASPLAKKLVIKICGRSF